PEYSDIKRARASGFTLYMLFMECVYWFGLGPLVDLWVKWVRSKAVWPPEVQELLKPDADVSAFDTTPICPHTDVFYRYDYSHGGYYFCDENGERITA